MFKSSLGKFVVLSLFVCFLVVGQEGQVRAQSTLEYAVLQSLISAELQSQPHFKFKLEAFDALTHGAVTAETKQVVFGILATNESAISYSVTFNPNMELIVNIPQDGNGLGDTAIPVNIPVTLTIPAFSDQLYYIASAPTNNLDVVTIKNTSTTHSLLGMVNFNFAYTPAGGTAQTLNGLLATDVIYKPSNNDLIPLIVNNQTTDSNKLTAVQTSLNSIETTVTNIWNRLVQYLRMVI